MWLLRMLKHAFIRLSAALKRAAEASFLLRVVSIIVAIIVPAPLAIASIMAVAAKIDTPPIITAVFEVGLLGALLVTLKFLPLAVVAMAAIGVADMLIDLREEYEYWRAVP